MKSLRRFFAILFIAGLLEGGTTGKIAGTVTGSDGQSLAGANVVVEDLYLGAAADADGRYYILNVPPGTYTLTFSMIGYKTLKTEEVVVHSDLTTTVNAVLEVTVLESGEEITVKAHRPMIQKDATASAAIISSQTIEDSPVETFQAIVQTKAGVSVDAGGALHFRGGRSDEIAYLIDGVPNVNPFNNLIGVDIATNAIEELSVITGSFSAEYGQAMSGVVNIITKNPGKVFHGSVSYMGGDMLTNYDLDVHPIIQDYAQPYNLGNLQETEATLTGYLPFWDRVRFFVSMRKNQRQGTLFGFSKYNAYGALQDSSDWKVFAANPSDKLNLQTKLSYYVNNNIKLQYNYISENQSWKSYSHTRKYLKWGHYWNVKDAETHMLQWTHQLGTKTFYTLNYSNSRNFYEYYAYRNPEDPRLVWGGYYVRDSNYEFYSGGTNNARYEREVKTNLFNAQLTSQVADHHEVKVGFERRNHAFDLLSWSINVDRRDEPWTDANQNGAWDDGETFTDLNGNGIWDSAKDDNGDGIPGSIDIPSRSLLTNSYTNNPVEMSGYVQDKIEMEDFILNIGYRWDYYDPDGRVALDWNDPDTNQTKPATVKTQFSPRFSIAFPITTTGKLFFSYGHFFQMPPYNRLYTNADFNVLPGVIKSDIGNADLNPQKTVSYEVGFEQAITTDMAIYVKVFYRDMKNLLGQKVYILPGGSDSYALFINRDWGNVKGVTFSLEKRLSNWISGSIDYTYQVAVGNESDPTRTRRDFRLSIEPQKKVVFLNWDQPHAFRFVLNMGPGSWRISTIGRLESGYPYTPADANALIRVAEENSGRKPVQANVDVTAYKIFHISKGSAKAFVKVYNLFDRRNENYVHDSSGRAGYTLGRFGDESTAEYTNRPNWYSTPRVVYVGLEFNI
ncbi:MAG: TonB-dependent receptor [FCB group bacterium]|nr:TonB-dependent receptor [FCB group bacterium]